MALSTGQVNDAYQQALGRNPTGQELQKYTGDQSFDGSPGQQRLISQLKGVPYNPQNSNQGFASNSTPQNTNFEDLANKAIQMNQQAVQPAVTALQATKQPLQDRYTALLSQIKNNQSIAENRQTVTTNNELGARGILPSSGLAQQTLTNAVNPITQEYSSEYAQGVAGEQSDLADIDAKIAQILSGAATSGINTGASLYGTNVNAGLTGQSLGLQQATLQNTIQQQAIQNALSQAQLSNQTKQTNYDINKPYYSPLESAQANYYNNPQAILEALGISGSNSSSGISSFVGK